jgi:hypothetical protein
VNLGIEDETVHMHVSSVAIFEAKPLQRDAALPPEVAWTPLTGHPV